MAEVPRRPLVVEVDVWAVTPWDWHPPMPWTCPRCGMAVLTREPAPICPRCLFRDDP